MKFRLLYGRRKVSGERVPAEIIRSEVGDLAWWLEVRRRIGIVASRDYEQRLVKKIAS